MAAELGGDLESVHTQTKQHLDDVLDVVVDLLGLEKLAFVIGKHRFREDLAAARLALGLLQLVEQDLVVFAELDLVRLDRVSQALRPVPPVLQVVQVLKTRSRDLEYLLRLVEDHLMLLLRRLQTWWLPLQELD